MWAVLTKLLNIYKYIVNYKLPIQRTCVCPTGLYLGICQVCPPLLYTCNVITNICDPIPPLICDVSCTTCNAALNPNACLLCPNGFYLDFSAGRTSVDVGKCVSLAASCTVPNIYLYYSGMFNGNLVADAV